MASTARHFTPQLQETSTILSDMACWSKDYALETDIHNHFYYHVYCVQHITRQPGWVLTEQTATTSLLIVYQLTHLYGCIGLGSSSVLESFTPSYFLLKLCNVYTFLWSLCAVVTKTLVSWNIMLEPSFWKSMLSYCGFLGCHNKKFLWCSNINVPMLYFVVPT